MGEPTFGIYIPSYKRAKTCTAHKFLEYGTYIVRASEYEEYVEALKDYADHIKVQAVEDSLICGLTEVNQWLIDNAPEDIIAQTRRLDGAGIGYHFFYLAGIAGAGKGRESAVRSAKIFNRTRPRRVGSSMLTVFPESRLYREIQAGNWTEAGEKEKLEEVRTLVEHLDIPVIFAALGASNAVNMEGRLPEDRARLLSALDGVIAQYSEADLRRYREGLPHL